MTFRDGGDLEIGNRQLRSFVGARSTVIQEEQQRIVTTPLCGLTIGSVEQGVHLRFFQISDLGLRRFLGWDGPDVPTPGYVFGARQADEASQRMNRGEPLIARGNTATTLFLQMQKKLADKFGRQIVDRQMIWRLARLRRQIRQKQNERIAVTMLSVARQIEIADQILKEKATD